MVTVAEPPVAVPTEPLEASPADGGSNDDGGADNASGEDDPPNTDE